MRVITRSQVEALLDPDELVEAVGRAMCDVSSGAASMPARIASIVAQQGVLRGVLACMPVYLPSFPVLACKLVAPFPGNAALGLSTHAAVVVVFDPDTGTPKALMDGESITASRTAAGSVLATRYLARPDAAVLAILGTGVQARAHAHAMARFKPWREIRVAGRNHLKAIQLAAELRDQLAVAVRPCASFQEALAGADVACATTNAPEPVVRREWLAPGMHVNSVGFSALGPEVDAATVVDALVVVESRQVALAPFPVGAHDLYRPLEAKLISADHIHAEVGELALGIRTGRTASDQITLYKSVGVAAQDGAAAAVVLRAAEERGVGLELAM